MCAAVAAVGAYRAVAAASADAVKTLCAGSTCAFVRMCAAVAAVGAYRAVVGASAVTGEAFVAGGAVAANRAGAAERFLRTRASACLTGDAFATAAGTGDGMLTTRARRGFVTFIASPSRVQLYVFGYPDYIIRLIRRTRAVRRCGPSCDVKTGARE